MALESRIITEADRYGFSENAVKILMSRYLAKNSLGEIVETISGMFHRVAKFVSEAEDGATNQRIYRDKFFDMMIKRDFLPNSPTLFNAGLGSGCLFACFVFTVEDSMEGIMQTATEIARCQKFGGGTGMAFSRLRPKGSLIRSTHGKACGALAVMEMYSGISKMITQAGRRNGANMGILRVDHPELIDFITCKNDNTSLANYNISVAITDEFMQALLTNDYFSLRFNDVIYAKLPAQEIWSLILNSAWKTGDPGLFFYDRANAWNPLKWSTIEGTNPCQPTYATVLTKTGISTIGSIKIGDEIWSGRRWTRVVNKWFTGVKPVYKFATMTGSFVGTQNHKIFSNGEKIKVGDAETIDVCVGDVFLDNLEYKTLPIKSIEYLGEEEVFDITVDDEEHMYWTDGCLVSNCGEVAGIDGYVCILGSINLSNCVTLSKTVDWAKIEELSHLGIRFLDDAVTMSMYPTKATEDIARKVRPLGLGIMGLADLFLKLGIRYGSPESFKLAEEIMRKINDGAWEESKQLSKGKGLIELSEFYHTKKHCQVTTVAPTGSLSLIAGTSSGIEPNFAFRWKSYQADQELYHTHPLLNGTDKLPAYFVTADEVSPGDHVRMQASVQKYTSNGVSKTVSLPNSAVVDDVDQVYRLSYELGCRGITVFRDGCKGSQVLVKDQIKHVEPDQSFAMTTDESEYVGSLCSLNNE